MRNAVWSVLFSCLLGVAAVPSASAVPITYIGQVTSGSGSQGGTAVFALDPASAFSYSFDDVDGNGLDAGDVLRVMATADIRDYTGDLSGIYTLGSTLGSLTLTGSLTVGGATGGYYSNSLDGSLDYVASFTGTPSHGGGLGPGVTLAGAADIAGGILGYGGLQPDLHFRLSGTGEQLAFGAGVRGVVGDCSEVPTPPGCEPNPSVPAPYPLVLLGGGLVMLGVATRRRRR
jgi:hypothetical protein